MQHDFFRLLSPADFTALLQQFPPTGCQAVDLPQALGRVAACDLRAPEDLPLANRSCMDGYAVRARDLFGASQGAPAYLECVGSLAIDQAPGFTLQPGACVAIPTGGTLPDGADAVAMVEYTHELGGGAIEIYKSLAPAENVMLKAEDAAQGQIVIACGARLRSQEIGLLAGLGITRLEVYAAPRVGILSTGDELVPPEQKPRPGQIRDVNSIALACLAAEAGGLPTQYGIVPDDFDSLAAALAAALDANDLVLISGGSSIGTRDLTLATLESLPDCRVLAHGVAISPGKPTILASVAGKPVLGLPGQVTSAQIVMLVFGQPLLRQLAGERGCFDPARRSTRPALLAQNLSSKPGREDYVRVRLETLPNGQQNAWPLTGKSGLLKTLVQAQGLICVPATREGLLAGTTVEVWTL